MEKQKFYVIGIVTGVITFLLGFFMAPIESMVLGIVSLIINIRKKSEYRIRIGSAFTIAGMLIGALVLIFDLWMKWKGVGSTDYWLFKLM